MFRQIVILLTLSLVAGAATWQLHPRMVAYPEGRLEEGAVLVSALPADMGLIQWIDARTEEEFATGHMPGALNLNEDNWETKLTDLLMLWDPAVPIVVYCASGGCQSSKAVAQRLKAELQTEAIFHLQGGWEALQEVAP